MSNEEDLNKIFKTDGYCFSPCVAAPVEHSEKDVNSEIDYIAHRFNRGEISIEEAKELMANISPRIVEENKTVDLDWGTLNE